MSAQTQDELPQETAPAPPYLKTVLSLVPADAELRGASIRPVVDDREAHFIVRELAPTHGSFGYIVEGAADVQREIRFNLLFWL